MPVIVERMQSARGTAAQWTSVNPVLLAGELGFETDTGLFKFGDGTTAWTSLAYNGRQAVGTATMAAGTIAVTGLTKTTANTVVRLSYRTIGGTPGAVFISAKTAGTGFTIKSTSATDTSVITWEVLSW